MAQREGVVRVYSTTHADVADQINLDFAKANPGIKVEYHDLTTAELFRQVIADAKSNKPGADIVVSTAMDLQAKLVNDGFAQPYHSPEAAALPAWATWKDRAYAVTAEPIVIVYNKTLVAPADVPRSHVELTALLERRADDFKDRVSSYDPSASDTGLMLLAQDVRATSETWSLAKALGRVHAGLYASSKDIIDRVASGRDAIGYNVIGSYVEDRRRSDPNLGIIYPSDYTLLVSRFAFISARAKHPQAARRFLDFLLSRAGQRDLARRGAGSVRRDLGAQGGGVLGVNTRPIRIGLDLLAEVDQSSRARLLNRWRAALRTSPP